MPTVTLEIDERTAERLARIGEETGDSVSRTAERLLARAARAAGPRPRFDVAAIRSAQSEFAGEDASLADSAEAERTALLAQEDTA